LKRQKPTSNLITFQSLEQKREAAKAAKYAVVPEMKFSLQISLQSDNHNSMLVEKYELEQLGMEYGKFLFGLRDLCERKPDPEREGEIWVQLCSDQNAILIFRAKLPDLTALEALLRSYYSSKRPQKSARMN
jgi:hypothetical protein